MAEGLDHRGFRCVVRNADIVAWTWSVLIRMDPVFGDVFSRLPEAEQVDHSMKLFTGAMAELAQDLARRCGVTAPTVSRVFSWPGGPSEDAV